MNDGCQTIRRLDVDSTCGGYGYLGAFLHKLPEGKHLYASLKLFRIRASYSRHVIVETDDDCPRNGSCIKYMTHSRHK